MRELEPGETIDLGMRTGDGPAFRRDPDVTEEFKIMKDGGVLYRDEIKKLAESAGFEVCDNE